MSLLGQSNSFGGNFGNNAATTTVPNPNNDMEVSNPPDDSISALAFSPAALPQNFLVAGSWDNNVRCWEIDAQGKSVPKSQQTMQGPVLDVCWQDDGQKVFMAGCDKTVKMWDLATNQSTQVQHSGNLLFKLSNIILKINLF